MASPRLLSLPNEILSEIIRHTVPESIEKISMTCKLLYRISATSIAEHQYLKSQYSYLDIYALNEWGVIQDSKLAAIDILVAISHDPCIMWYPKSAHLRATGYDPYMEAQPNESYVMFKERYR